MSKNVYEIERPQLVLSIKNDFFLCIVSMGDNRSLFNLLIECGHSENDALAHIETMTKSCVSTIDIAVSTISTIIDPEWIIIPMPRDGNCMFSSVGYFMSMSSSEVRKIAIEWLENHQIDSEFIITESISELINRTRSEGIFGEEAHLFAMSNAYRCKITIISERGHDCDFTPEYYDKHIYLAYSANLHYDVIVIQ